MKRRLIINDSFTQEIWGGTVNMGVGEKEQHIYTRITANEYGQLVLEDLKYTWAQRERTARNEKGSSLQEDRGEVGQEIVRDEGVLEQGNAEDVMHEGGEGR